LHLNAGASSADSTAWVNSSGSLGADVALGTSIVDGDLDLHLRYHLRQLRSHLNVDGALLSRHGLAGRQSGRRFGLSLGDVDGDGDLGSGLRGRRLPGVLLTGNTGNAVREHAVLGKHGGFD
jgi:hypothetical protein